MLGVEAPGLTQPSVTGSRLAHPRFVALLLAGFCAIVLHTRVYDDFERVRFLIVRAARAASLGVVSVTLPDLSRLSGQPAAIVLRFTNDGSAMRVARVAVGGATLADVPLAPGRQVRVDLSLPDGTALSLGDRLDIRSDGDGWSLTYLEMSNTHGFSRGLFEFVIVPASARASDRLGLLVTLLVFGVLLVLPTSSSRILTHRIVRTVYVAMASLVLLFLTATLISPVVTDYAVLLAAHSFVLCTVILYSPALGAVAGSLVPVIVPMLRWTWAHFWSRRVELLYVASLVLFITSMAQFHDRETGFTTLIRFGDSFHDQALPAVRAVPHYVVENSGGYDGQFYAQLAVDPLLLDPAIDDALDSPVYRARRILFSWTAFLLGLGQPRRILQAYAIQNVLFWVLLALLLCRWFPPRDLRSFCLWFGCMFSHGVIVSVTVAVPDGPGMLLLALTVLTVERGRTRSAAGLVGLAGLAKDINLLWAVILIAPDSLTRTRWRHLFVWGLLVAGPVSMWMLYLWASGHDFGNFAGLRNFAAPFTGYVEQWNVTLSALHAEGWDSFARFSLLALIGFTTQAAVLLILRDWQNPWWRVGMGSVVLMVVLGPAVWEGSPGAVTRVLLPMTFAFNAVLPRNRWFWPLVVLGNLMVLPALQALRIPFWELL